ncbi:FHA domain-containing protein [Ditylenchus destructor]|nr:FHA domain-containing protein [Ditylenchus destructor]
MSSTSDMEVSTIFEGKSLDQTSSVEASSPTSHETTPIPVPTSTSADKNIPIDEGLTPDIGFEPKNMPTGDSVDSDGNPKAVGKSDDPNQNTKIRRSTRDIKRPKFDDELVESVVLSKLTPRKRHLNERSLHSPDEEEMRNAKKRPHKSSTGIVPDGTQQPGPSESKRSPTSSPVPAAKNLPADTPLQKTAPIEPEPENSLASDRRKKQQLANRSQKPNPKHFSQQAQAYNNAAETAESMKRWTVEDDVALVAAVTHVCDLRTVYNFMKFSKKYSLVEIEERWYELLYDENVSRLARKRMDALGRDKIRAIQAKIPFTTDEEDVIKSVSSTTSGTLTQVFDKLLDQNRQALHHARTAKVLEDYWRELKYYGLLLDQRPVIFDDDLLQIEKNFDLTTLVEGDCLPLDIEERQSTRNVVVSEREAQEWEKVFVKAVTGVSSSIQMAPDTIAVLRGRSVTFDIRKDKALIGRSTRRHRVDVNLTLEGPSARVSRKQALMKLYDNDEFILHNLGKQTIYVDGKSLLQGDKARLHNNSIIEIALIRLHFIPNENRRSQQLTGSQMQPASSQSSTVSSQPQTSAFQPGQLSAPNVSQAQQTPFQGTPPLKSEPSLGETESSENGLQNSSTSANINGTRQIQS